MLQAVKFRELFVKFVIYFVKFHFRLIDNHFYLCKICERLVLRIIFNIKQIILLNNLPKEYK
ncbi:hypothetical protein C4O85_13410 [Mannheimia haemolytica]|nr:hypothetical protein C4O85_13410 [Mannheimia haemolytica]